MNKGIVKRKENLKKQNQYNMYMGIDGKETNCRMQNNIYELRGKKTPTTKTKKKAIQTKRIY